jgi:hypothetical protein
MKFKKLLFLFFIVAVILSSCTTYLMDTKTLVENLHGATKDSLTTKYLNGYYLARGRYEANSVSKIKCYTKEGAVFYLDNSPSIEMKVTLKDGGVRIFYFDTMYLQDTMLYGCDSRILRNYRSISINRIENIYIQDGHKNYSN